MDRGVEMMKEKTNFLNLLDTYGTARNLVFVFIDSLNDSI